MFQANNSTPLACADGDAAGNIAVGVEADLLITSINSRYTKLWRRSWYIVIFISLKKSASSDHDPPPPSVIPEAPTRTSSAKSNCAIDIHSDNEDKNAVSEIEEEKKFSWLRNILGFGGPASIIGQPHSEEGTVDDENHRVLKTSKPVDGASFSYFLWNSCKRNRYTIFVLLFSGVLSFSTEIMNEGPKYGCLDGIAILIAVFVLVTFPSVANFWNYRKNIRLLKNKNESKVTVMRGEKTEEIAISDLKVGDRVCLKSGDEVPADGLLLNGDNFELDPKIDAGIKPLLFSGSKVVKGDGCMLVTSVGDKMYLSEMHTLTAHGPEKRKVLESRIEKPISYIDNLAILISLIIALVVLIRLICKHDGDNNGLPEIKGKVPLDFLMETLKRIFFRPQGKISILTSILSVAAICVQHGMPLTITLSLMYQLDKVVTDQAAEVHDLSTFGTMGLVTVFCIDAYSELICKLVEVSKVWIGEKDISTEVGSETDNVILELFQQAIGASVLAPELSISPMLNSLVSWAEKWGMNIVSFSQNLTIVQHRKPRSVKEGSGVLVRKVGDDEQVLHLHCSGAASTILNMCSHYYDSRGECHAIENQKTKFVGLVQDMENSGLRPFAFAYRKTEVHELKQDGLILLAVIGLKYTFLEEAKSALKDLKNAGIKIKLVSEEDFTVVRRIACELELLADSVLSEKFLVLEGEQIEDLAGTTRLDNVDLASLMGSFLPKDKLVMVQCLQEKDHVVAFIGGSTTIDAEILKKADIGIVEISRSTAKAKDNSGICIKCFSALTPIVKAGRHVYQNVQKFVQLQLTTCISGSLISLITAISIGDSPLTAVQLIWVNVVMSFLGGHMMLMKFTGEEQPAIEPFDNKQSLLTKEIRTNIVIQVFYQVSVSMMLQFGGQVVQNVNEVRTPMIFNTFMLCQVFNQLHVMQLWKMRVFKAVLHSYTFLGALGTSLLLQVLVIHYAEGLAADGRQLNSVQWAICFLFGSLSWGFDYTFKFLAAYLKTLCVTVSVNSPSGFSSSGRWFYLSYLQIPFLMVLFLHVPLYIERIGMPFR